VSNSGVLFSLFVVLLAGCGDSQGFVSVTGTVKYDDGAIPTGETAMVLFQPIGGEGRAAYGEIAADGSFKLTTKQPGDGVMPGQYKVVLKVAEDYRSGKSAVPAKYDDASTTPLEAEVRRDQRHFDFVVER